MNNILNIPIYRAKLKEHNEWVEGYLTPDKHIDGEWFIREIDNLNLYIRIDPSTVSIIKGNKIKKIFIIIIMLFTIVNASDWKTEIRLDNIRMVDTSQIAQEYDLKAKRMCKQHIAKTITFRDNMNDSDTDKQKLEHYIKLVKIFCSKVAGCENCKRK